MQQILGRQFGAGRSPELQCGKKAAIESRRLAAVEAAKARRRYGHAMTYYRCKSCGKYHLTKGDAERVAF